MEDIDFKEGENDLKLETEVDSQEDKGKFARKEIFIQEKDKTLEKIYQDNDFQTIHRPPKMTSRILIISIVISIIFGILIGFFGAFFIFSKKDLIPTFLRKINSGIILNKII